MHGSRLIFLTMALGALACQTRPAKAPLDESGLSKAGKADWFGSKIEELGTIGSNETRWFDYRNPPLYRSYRFYSPPGGVAFAASVSAPGQSEESADPVAWLLDSRYAVITESDDADPTTVDSLLLASWLPEGVYHIVVRDYAKRPATFRLTVMANAEEDGGLGDAGVRDGGIPDARVHDGWVVPDASVGDAQVADAGVGDAHVEDAATGDAGVLPDAWWW